jgi:uncharacterized membrane protein YsdA (DUF1294 family)
MQRRRPVLFHMLASLILASLLALGTWRLFHLSWNWPAALWAWVFGITLTTFAYYGWDKRQAQREGARVPEMVLHMLALIGGSLGAYAGMQLFRHKTLKGRFRLMFWLIALIQMGLLTWLAYEWWRG